MVSAVAFIVNLCVSVLLLLGPVLASAAGEDAELRLELASVVRIS